MMVDGITPDTAAPEWTAGTPVLTVPSLSVTAVEKRGLVAEMIGIGPPVEAVARDTVVVVSPLPKGGGKVTAADRVGRVTACEMGTWVVRVVWSLEIVTGTTVDTVAGGNPVVVGGTTTGTSVVKVVWSFDTTNGADVDSSVTPEGRTVGTVTPTSPVIVV